MFCATKQPPIQLSYYKIFSECKYECKQVYSEWYDTVSEEEIDNVYILREMIEVREGWAISDIFNIGDADVIISDLYAD